VPFVLAIQLWSSSVLLANMRAPDGKVFVWQEAGFAHEVIPGVVEAPCQFNSAPRDPLFSVLLQIFIEVAPPLTNRSAVDPPVVVVVPRTRL